MDDGHFTNCFRCFWAGNQTSANSKRVGTSGKVLIVLAIIAITAAVIWLKFNSDQDAPSRFQKKNSDFSSSKQRSGMKKTIFLF